MRYAALVEFGWLATNVYNSNPLPMFNFDVVVSCARCSDQDMLVLDGAKCLQSTDMYITFPVLALALSFKDKVHVDIMARVGGIRMDDMCTNIGVLNKLLSEPALNGCREVVQTLNP